MFIRFLPFRFIPHRSCWICVDLHNEDARNRSNDADASGVCVHAGTRRNMIALPLFRQAERDEPMDEIVLEMVASPTT